RTTRLESDQDLVNGRGGGVGRRNDRGDNAERLGDLDHPPVFVPGDDADRAHRPDEAIDLVGGEEVLLDLVLDDAVARLLDGKPREPLRLGRRRRGHRIDNCVDLFLAELGELHPRLLGTAGERARLGDRGEIAVGLRAALDGRHHAPLGRILSTSECGRGMTWTDTSSPTRRAAAAPASVAAFTAPTSPRTMTVT